MLNAFSICKGVEEHEACYFESRDEYLLAMFVEQRLCINFSIPRANFLTTLRSHLDITSSCYFGSNFFNVDVNYTYIYKKKL